MNRSVISGSEKLIVLLKEMCNPVNNVVCGHENTCNLLHWLPLNEARLPSGYWAVNSPQINIIRNLFRRLNSVIAPDLENDLILFCRPEAQFTSCQLGKNRCLSSYYRILRVCRYYVHVSVAKGFGLRLAFRRRSKRCSYSNVLLLTVATKTVPGERVTQVLQL